MNVYQRVATEVRLVVRLSTVKVGDFKADSGGSHVVINLVRQIVPLTLLLRVEAADILVHILLGYIALKLSSFVKLVALTFIY